MAKEIVFVEDRIIKLDTSMTQSSFARSKSAEKLAEKGCLARKRTDGWTFEPWAFTDTSIKTHTDIVSGIERKANETVILEAKGFSGSTLKSLLEKSAAQNLTDGERAQIQMAGAAVCSALESTIQQKASVENVGAGGIVVSDDSSQILFLPFFHIESSALSLGEKEYSEHQGFYINPTLSGEAAIRFTQSVIAYRLLVGKLPFTETNAEKRHMDIVDSNYPPLASCVWALDDDLSSFIDNSLQRKPLIRNKKTGKRQATALADKIASIIVEKDKGSGEEKERRSELELSFPLESLYRELGLSEGGEIPVLGKLNSVIRKSTVSQEVFEQKNRKKADWFKKKLAVKRWLRSKKIPLMVSSAVALVLLILCMSFISGNSENPTSKGLTSTQTVEMFYSGMNKLDGIAMHECSTGDKASDLENMVTNFYVAGKAVAAYDATRKIVSPAEWMNFNYDGKYQMFGLSDFSIQTSKASLFFTAPAKKTRPKTIQDDNGKEIKKGDKITIPVSYALLFSEDTSISVTYHNDNVTLEFKKDRWIITDIEENEGQPLLVDYNSFYEDYRATFTGKDIDKNPVTTANELRGKYPWIPTNSEILEAQQKMVQEAF